MIPLEDISFLKHESRIFIFFMSENKLDLMQNIDFVKSVSFEDKH